MARCTCKRNPQAPMAFPSCFLQLQQSAAALCTLSPSTKLKRQFDWRLKSLMHNVPVHLARPSPRKQKAKLLLLLARPSPRGSSYAKAPVVVTPCMAFTYKNSTCQEKLLEEPHLGNQFVKGHQLRIFAVSRSVFFYVIFNSLSQYFFILLY